MRYVQDMREADQEFVRSAMHKIEEETCLRFNEQEGVFLHSHLDVFFSASISEFKKNNIWSTSLMCFVSFSSLVHKVLMYVWRFGSYTCVVNQVH